MPAVIRRALDEDFAEGNSDARHRAERGARLEVVGRDLPDLVDVLADGPMVPARRAQAQAAKDLRI